MQEYYTFSKFLKEKYKEKVWKVSIDAGFECPNRNELSGRGGCIFCRMDSFSKCQSEYNINIYDQIREGIELGRERLGIEKYIIYFQASTNTNAPVEILKELYEKAIDFDGVVGLSIATRPDCLENDVIDLINELAHKVDVWVELGLQSAHNKTLELLNRGHSFEDYAVAVEKLSKLPVRICTHIMLGLPGENRQDVLHTAKILAHSPIHEVKLHPLLVLKDTILAKMYEQKKFKSLELEEYASLACDFIEQLPANMVIQRLTAESPHDILLAPLWTKNKHAVINSIRQEFKNRQTYQGFFLNTPSN